MATIRLAGNNIGGYVQGQFGTYQQGSDGVFTVDTRDAPALLAMGMTYLSNAGDSYTTPKAPAAATAGQIIASTTLANGTVAISNQPDLMRQVQIIMGTGTTAITAGSAAVTYVGSDMATHTDTFSAVQPASGSVTFSLSRGAISISTVNISALVGGTSPFIRMDTTALIAVPSDPFAQDFVLLNEIDTTSRQTTPGTFSTSSLGCTTVQNAPNGTQTYSLAYAYVAPEV